MPRMPRLEWSRGLSGQETEELARRHFALSTVSGEPSKLPRPGRQHDASRWKSARQWLTGVNDVDFADEQTPGIGALLLIDLTHVFDGCGDD